jgi:hypothetical protein
VVPNSDGVNSWRGFVFLMMMVAGYCSVLFSWEFESILFKTCKFLLPVDDFLLPSSSCTDGRT